MERTRHDPWRSKSVGPDPLPACAQFLNVIESVFSGMSRAVIQNSDYESVEDARAAIDRHFTDRNAYFRANPKRAGRKICGNENTPSEFSAPNNCKDRHRCFFGISPSPRQEQSSDRRDGCAGKDADPCC
jgi:hypothetical protein